MQKEAAPCILQIDAAGLEALDLECGDTAVDGSEGAGVEVSQDNNLDCRGRLELNPLKL